MHLCSIEIKRSKFNVKKLLSYIHSKKRATFNSYIFAIHILIPLTTTDVREEAVAKLKLTFNCAVIAVSKHRLYGKRR